MQRLHEDAGQRAPRVRHEPLADVVGEAARGHDDAHREREPPRIESRLLAERRDAFEQQGFDGARAARRPDAASGSRPRAVLAHDLDHPDLPGRRVAGILRGRRVSAGHALESLGPEQNAVNDLTY